MIIVILDKSSTVRTKISDLLEEMEFDGLDINEFEDAQEALDFIKTNSVDIIFSSIETDGIDGITFVDLLIRGNARIVSRLFIVTSQKNSDSFMEIKDVGAKRFIRKPINEDSFKHFVIPEIRKILHFKE